MFYYSVYKGHVKGIYSTWNDCYNNIKGYPDAMFQKFENLNDAEYFLKFGNEPKKNEKKTQKKIYLNVSLDKHKIEVLGGKWDNNNKKWYISNPEINENGCLFSEKEVTNIKKLFNEL